MVLRSTRSFRRTRPVASTLTVVLILVLMLGGVREASRGSGTPAGATAVWRAGRSVAIAVNAGQARFSVPTPGPGSRTLVVVSALARGAGPFPVRLTARAIDPSTCRIPERVPEEPRRDASLVRPPLPPIAAPGSALPPRQRTFHLMVRDGDVASASNYLAVEGTLRALGQRVQVYVDAGDLARVGPEVLADVVTTFDDRVFPVAARTFGQARDVDGDGRFTVLMSSWLTRLAGGRHAVDGFVRGADLERALPEPFSNHCDMMYLSTALVSGPHLRTVLAHEYTHAVTFCAKTTAGGGPGAPGVEEEGWLDEALAHLAEDLHGFSRSNLDYRVSAFLSQPERYRLVVDDYYAADLFRSHGNRGGTYLFLRWCADQYGPGLLPALIGSERRGVANLEAATGARFADLYRAWSVALFLTGFDPSLGRQDGFRTIDLRGRLDDWELAGPRTVVVRPDGRPVEWASAGTASRFLVVEPGPDGAVEVEVSAGFEAGLQVTAVPLPDDLPRVELSVSATTGKDGLPCLVARLGESGGQSVRLSSLSWEPLVPGPDPHAPAFRHDGLDAAGIAASFGTAALPAGGRLASRPIPAAEALRSGAPLVVKAVGIDAHGRRVTAWAELVEPPPGALAGQTATAHDRAERR
jgi:hypothetical protein